MTGHVITPDYDALPTALLDLAKKHCRVSFNTDDEIIKEYIKWAISYFEKFSGQQIFPAQVAWTPPVVGWALPTPVQPVSAFTVILDGVDISDQFRLQAADPVAPVWLIRIDRTPFPTGAEITLTGGFADPAKMDPSMLGTVLRITAKLYEYRESISDLNLDDVPFWMNDMITGHWIPRA